MIMVNQLVIHDKQPELLYPMNGSLLFRMYDKLNWFHNNKQSTTTTIIPAIIPYGTFIATIRGKNPDAG